MNLKMWDQKDAWWQAQQDAKSLATVLIRKKIITILNIEITIYINY